MPASGTASVARRILDFFANLLMRSPVEKNFGEYSENDINMPASRQSNVTASACLAQF